MIRKANADKPHLWKADIAASVDLFNRWFLSFAPETFRSARSRTVEQVKRAMVATADLSKITPSVLWEHLGILPALRMATAPPLAVDRLVGLSQAQKSFVWRLDAGKHSTRTSQRALVEQLSRICSVLRALLDEDIFPWLGAARSATTEERERSSTIVADRLCGAVANPIIRNAQEQRQLSVIAKWLKRRGYCHERHPCTRPLDEMRSGTYCLRMNVAAGKGRKVNIPVDLVAQPISGRQKLPVLIEAKSAGDFTNTNKRRKEEATKIHQLHETYGPGVRYVLFLCGYFGSDYLGYEAAEGLDWVWEHRVGDMAKLGL
jgi:hypothetical protein